MSSTEKTVAADTIGAALTKTLGAGESASAKGMYHMQCFDKNGNLKWESNCPNLVVNVGLQDMNTKYFTGSSYTAAWYIGLYGAAASNTPAASDTMSSHAGWTEISAAYSQSTRPSVNFSSAPPTNANPSVATNSGSASQFSITSSTTIGGAFLVNNNTKGGSTGILFSASDFAAGGDRAVVNGDTLNVTYTLSLAG
jgi:hypothetical protein